MLSKYLDHVFKTTIDHGKDLCTVLFSKLSNLSIDLSFFFKLLREEIKLIYDLLFVVLYDN